jgi:hypothetical protein
MDKCDRIVAIRTKIEKGGNLEGDDIKECSGVSCDLVFGYSKEVKFQSKIPGDILFFPRNERSDGLAE